MFFQGVLTRRKLVILVVKLLYPVRSGCILSYLLWIIGNRSSCKKTKRTKSPYLDAGQFLFFSFLTLWYCGPCQPCSSVLKSWILSLDPSAGACFHQIWTNTSCSNRMWLFHLPFILTSFSNWNKCHAQASRSLVELKFVCSLQAFVGGAPGLYRHNTSVSESSTYML